LGGGLRPPPNSMAKIKRTVGVYERPEKSRPPWLIAATIVAVIVAVAIALGLLSSTL
jgi:hypothetical protein